LAPLALHHRQGASLTETGTACSLLPLTGLFCAVCLPLVCACRFSRLLSACWVLEKPTLAEQTSAAQPRHLSRVERVGPLMPLQGSKRRHSSSTAHAAARRRAAPPRRRAVLRHGASTRRAARGAARGARHGDGALEPRAPARGTLGHPASAAAILPSFPSTLLDAPPGPSPRPSHTNLTAASAPSLVAPSRVLPAAAALAAAARLAAGTASLAGPVSRRCVTSLSAGLRATRAPLRPLSRSCLSLSAAAASRLSHLAVCSACAC
jgi:hypothetical protein